MTRREFAISQALARHALYAASELPLGHPQREIVRHQVARLQMELAASNDIQDRDNAIKIGELGAWFDNGAIRSNEQVVLS